MGLMRQRSGNVPYVAQSFWAYFLWPRASYPQITWPRESCAVVVRTVQLSSHRFGSSTGRDGSGQNSYSPAKAGTFSFSVPACLFSGIPLRAPYTPFLGHLSRNQPHRAVTVRVRRRRKSAPTLTPTQIQLIKDCCARYDPLLATWIRSVRDRLFFALLEKTGLRLVEALCLQHRDCVQHFSHCTFCVHS
jgi:hypothetical protein